MAMKWNPTERRPRAVARMSMVVAAAWAAVAAAQTPPPAAERRPPVPTKGAAVLETSADGFVLGSLVPAPAVDGAARSTLLWRSPLFAGPIEFAIDGIDRIRFARVDVPRPAAADWRVGLRGGSFVAGAIEAIDADHVVLAVPGVADGRLRIRRTAIERISRDSAAGQVLVPGGLDGWDVARGAWQEQAGRLVCDTVGSDAFRDVAAPPRACFELVLAWDERPEFELFFAGDTTRSAAKPKAKETKDKKPAPQEERYRVDMAGGDMLAIREGAKEGKFDAIAAVRPGAGGVHVQVFVDQPAGRMAVVLPKGESPGKAVFDETLAPAKPGNRTGFGIRLRSGKIRIDELRVAPWTDAEPRLVNSGGLGGPTAALESFDKAKGTFTFRGPEGPREVAAADVSMIEFPAEGAGVSEHAPGSVMVAFHGGSRLAGRIMEVGENAVRLDCPAVADPVVGQFPQLAEIESLAVRATAPLPGRPGRFDAEAGRMVGCLANMAPAGGVAWQPLGAVRPVPIADQLPARILFRGINGLGGVGLEFARQGKEFRVASLVAGGPAARDGRIQRGWRLDAIRLDPAAQPIETGSLKPEDVRGLLRGVVGSSVVLTVADPAGKAQEIPLVRDAGGRGDLAGGAEQDVLEAVLKMHAARIVHGPAAAGQATVYLKTGDSITCTVVSADPQGLKIRIDAIGETIVPAVAVRAVELLPGAGTGISREKLARLLTLPRMQQADPPTHMLRLPNGDYLRGKLLALDDNEVRIDVLGVVKSLPRAAASRLIWLSVEGDETDAKAVEAVMGGADKVGVPMRATMTDGRHLSLMGERVDGDRLVGKSGVFGVVGVELARCGHLDVGRVATAAAPGELPYGKWKLTPAAPPRALQKSGPPAAGPRGDAVPGAAAAGGT